MRKYNKVKKDMFFRPDIIAISAILFALAYALLVHTMAPGEAWSWWHTFVATIVSIVFAGAIGIALFNYQTKISDDSRREELRSALATDLSHTIYILEKGEPMTIKLSASSPAEKMIITYIPPLIIENAAQSGLFSSSETSSLLLQARRINLYNAQVSYLHTLFSSSTSNLNFEDLARNTIKNVRKIQKGIVDNSRMMTEKMHLTPIAPPKEN